LGSAVDEAAAALAVKLPGAGAETTIWKIDTPAFANVPALQTTGPLPLHPLVLETSLVPAGSAKVALTALAGEGPPLVSVI
jgi:hypothetical protein